MNPENSPSFESVAGTQEAELNPEIVLRSATEVLNAERDSLFEKLESKERLKTWLAGLSAASALGIAYKMGEMKGIFPHVPYFESFEELPKIIENFGVIGFWNAVLNMAAVGYESLASQALKSELRGVEAAIRKSRKVSDVTRSE